LIDRLALLAGWEPETDTFFRRIGPNDLHFDEHLGRTRPQTGCFCDDSIEGGMSAYSSELLVRLGRSPAALLRRYPEHCLLAMPGALLVTKGQIIEAVPGDDSLDDCNHAHVNILGPKSKTLQKALRRLDFYVLPSKH
jgi:hypothetical protein